jgi:hypothetical protein
MVEKSLMYTRMRTRRNDFKHEKSRCSMEGVSHGEPRKLIKMGE